MNFAASDEEVMVREMAQKFAVSLREGAEPDEDVLFTRLADLGLMGALAPVEVGGSGISVAELAVAVEEIAAVDACTALLLTHHNSALVMLGQEPSAAELCKGQLALLVDQTGVEAHHRGGQWTLHGSASLVPGATRAAVAYAVASTTDGPALFSCEHDPDRAAVSTHGLERCGFGDLRFGGLKAKLIHSGSEFARALQIGRAAREVLIASCVVGLARGSLGDALNYANDREQFGKPLAAFQAIQFKLADMATAVDASRLLVRAAAADSTFQLHALQYARDQALFVCDEAVQIHGGYGYTREYAVEGRLRDTRYFLTLEGTR